MRPFDAGQAEERVVAVVRPQSDEPFVLPAGPPEQDPDDRWGQGCRSGSSRSAPHPAQRTPGRARPGTIPGPGWRRRCARPCPSATGAARTSTASPRSRRSQRGTPRSRPPPPPPAGGSGGPRPGGGRVRPPAQLRIPTPDPSTFSAATIARTLDSATCAPSSSISRCHTRRAVWRCLRGASRSATNQPRTVASSGPSAGETRTGAFGAGGTALREGLAHRAPMHPMPYRERADRQTLTTVVTSDTFELLHSRLLLQGLTFHDRLGRRHGQ